MGYDYDVSEAKTANLVEINTTQRVSADLLSDLLKAAQKGGHRVSHVFSDFNKLLKEKPDGTPWYDYPIIGIPPSLAGVSWKLAKQGRLISLFRRIGSGARVAPTDVAEADVAAGELGVAEGAAEGAIDTVACVGAVCVGLAAAAAGVVAYFMLKDEQQTHLVVNDSPYAFSFRPSKNLFNRHGKTVLLPDGHHKDVVVRIPPRDDQGRVTASMFGFQKKELALYGCSGGFELIPDEDVNDGKSDLPHYAKIAYDQPLTGDNGIAVSLNYTKNLHHLWDKYDDRGFHTKDCKSTRKDQHVTIYGGLSSSSGGNGKAVIYIHKD